MVYRGQVYYCDLGVGIGSEESKKIPCVIIQNDQGNLHSPNTIVAPITNEKALPVTSVAITGQYTYTDIEDNTSKQLSGYILLSNIITISKSRIVGSCIATLNNELNEMDSKILTSLGLYKKYGVLINKLDKEKKFIKKINMKTIDKKIFQK